MSGKGGGLMDFAVYNPLEEYENKFKALHLENTKKLFDSYAEQSGVNIEENRKTVELYNTYRENLSKLKKKYNLRRFFRVIMILTVVLIPVVIWKMTPKIRSLRKEIESADSKADSLLNEAYNQMLPLCGMFGDDDSLNLIEQTIPMISFDSRFSAEREEDMKINYDFGKQKDSEESTLDLLSGEYNENPFLFENRRIHTMGQCTYEGTKTITWTEIYTDSNGKRQRRTRTQTLHATVTKPKPYYTTQVVLNYGSQAGDKLSFGRDASHLEQKSEKAIERYVKKGEKKLKKKTDRAIEHNGDFMSMSNTDFEVLFDALDRDNEIQYRAIFTPLAQTNMVDLILSKSGFGDDFNFFKTCRMNKIITGHSQGRQLKLPHDVYSSYSFDIIEENFTGKNAEFFKQVYFDFAPLLAIPAYQERPVHSLKPIPELGRMYSQRECELLANAADSKLVVHPETKTSAILKTKFIESDGKADKTCITAYSYKTIPRVDIVSVRGDDGNYHDVPVDWKEYVPLTQKTDVYVSDSGNAKGKKVVAKKNGVCMFTNSHSVS